MPVRRSSAEEEAKLAAAKVKLQNYMKQELVHQSKCSICWQATCANWEFVCCLVICCLVWAACLFLWAGCEVAKWQSLELPEGAASVLGRSTSSGDAARSKLGGRLLPPSNIGGGGGGGSGGGQRQQQAEEAKPTDSSSQRAYFPLALQKSSEMFLINSASDCQMAKIGLWIFSGGLLILAIVGGICCCLQVKKT